MIAICDLDKIKNKNLILRRRINISNKITFGVELEFTNAKRTDIGDYLIGEYAKYKIAEDGSVTLYNRGGEVITPILSDKTKSWKQISHICDVINHNNGIINDKTSSHIHFGYQILGDLYENHQNYQNLIKLWTIFEDIIYRFSSGSDINCRSNINKYAAICAPIFINYINENQNEIIKHIITSLKNSSSSNSARDYGINFTNLKPNKTGKIQTKNTIEIRCPNGTLNPITIQNNVDFFAHFLQYCRKENFDTDYINFLLKNYFNNIYQSRLNIDEYNKLDIDKALILANLIYKDDINKSYFLRQYIKR